MGGEQEILIFAGPSSVVFCEGHPETQTLGKATKSLLECVYFPTGLSLFSQELTVVGKGRENASLWIVTNPGGPPPAGGLNGPG